ncbi:MAG: hypothetical protein IJQ02_12535 [Oscillospiraceae bacterium]|nr:hypothetical protein [Oscillospiraceae bacterium]
MKVLRVLKKIILLAWLVFLVLCTHSLVMQLHSSTGDEASPEVNTPALSVPFVQPSGVTLSSGTYAETTEDLTAVVTAEDLALLDTFPALRSADFSGSTCYEDIIAWAEAHPAVSVRYTVSLPDGQTADNAVTTLDLSEMNAADAGAAAALLRYLPKLTLVDLGVGTAENTIAGEDLAAIAEACPNAELRYALSLLGNEVSLDAKELDLSSLQSSQAAEAAAVLSSMTNLERITLGSQENGLSWADVNRIHEAAPNAVLDYSFSIWGVDANLQDEVLNLSHVKMNDEGAAVREVLPCMTRLQTLDMDFCEVSNDAMAQIRADYPDVDVIWRIWFAGYSVRTDVERILASSTARGGQVTDQEAKCLQYCNKVKYLDLGHNQVLTDISFVRGMPDLEVLILAINDVEDISPLADCPKLEYLEINSTNVTDLSPLSNSQALRHLNIGRTAHMDGNYGEDLLRPRVTDLTPLYGLSDLERLWIGSVVAEGIPMEQILKMCEVMGVDNLYNEDGTLNEYCERINITSGDPSQGTWRTTGSRPDWVWAEWERTGVFNDPLNERYLLLREQFGYDNANQNYSLPQNDPLY